MEHKIKLYIVGSFIEGECSCGERYEWGQLEKLFQCVKMYRNRSLFAKLIRYLYRKYGG